MERSRLHTRSFGERFTWGSYREWKVNVFNAKESLYIANIQFLMVGAPKQQKKQRKQKNRRMKWTRKKIWSHTNTVYKRARLFFLSAGKNCSVSSDVVFFGQCCFCRFSFFFSRASSSLCMFFRILCERAYVSDILSAARHTLSI